MTTAVTKESLAARIAELESGPRSLKEDYTLAAYKMLLATMEAEPVCFVSERNLATIIKYRASVYVKAEPEMVRPVALYRHAQQPVVQDEVKRCIEALAKLNNNLYRWTSRMSYNGSWVGEPEGLIKGHIREMEHILDSCRAAMLNQK